ncbi:4-hydroxybutyrate CoA-transferase [candidate division WOR-3 bacterium JGI_Cruoil_03_51_56]|uniref:4-hydroxybutyrate CoA-transferase n=1 Tax=candidate division WOR-3 bacterium JGI_Cruoil_03_51_56 TaxID=1973747 RepID=A0A235BW28_UNCW3|nr:MAG: 4-hydroxybutyrate CoA-transferase [candidate division WOR-3 bacterium JGI_Cruoil_03_51_56]
MAETDWHTRYQDKIKTADKALKILKPGNRLFIGSACGTPQRLVQALADRPIEDVEITHLLTLGVAPYAQEKLAGRYRANSFFISKNVRKAVQEGRADYTPIFLSEIPGLIRSGQMPIDVALIQVTPPDKHGFCSFGVSIDITKPAAEAARHIIAEVNPQMPRTLGDSFIHVSKLDALVENDTPIYEFITPGASEVARRIARNVADLIEDGSTIQVGYGGIPNALLHYLKDKKDLGIHTEVFSDGIIDLIESGVINNRRKTLHPHKVIASFVMGSKRLYDYIHNNPMFEFHPVDYTNDPFVIAQNDKMVSINSALEVDMTGQVCADSLGYKFYSGIGGQLDFVRGASRSHGGKAIIVLKSTRANEKYSRIVPVLSEGAGVTTSRGDVHYVVTEWGTAYLHGKSVRERALALISVAHPKFRRELMKQAKERNYIYADQPEAPLIEARYPEEFETTAKLRDGTQIFIRPIKPTDEEAMRNLFYSFSKETVFYRFFSYLKAMPHEKLSKFVNIDYKNEMALVAVIKPAGEEQIIGSCRYYVDKSTGLAEFAIVVQDEYQNNGVGTALFNYLIRIAKMKRLKGFIGYILDSNTRAYRLMTKTGNPIETKWENGVYTLTLRFQYGRK